MFNYGSFKLFLLKIFLGFCLLSFSFFLLVSIYTYNPNDPGIGRLVGKSDITNFFGFWGAIFSSVLLTLYGKASFFLIIFLVYFGIFIFLGLVGISNGLANVLGSSTWAEIYGVKFIGSIKALTTAFMVFSTAFGTAVFGLLIDIGFSIENIALIAGVYIVISLVLLLLIMKNLEPLEIRK